MENSTPLDADSASQEESSWFDSSNSTHVPLSATQMRKDIIIATQGMDLFFKAKFVEAEAVFTSQKNADNSLYLTLGLSLLRLVKSFFTFEADDISDTAKGLERTLKMSRLLKKRLERPNLAMRIYSSFWRGHEQPVNDEVTGEPISDEDIQFLLSQARLIEAESSLLLSMVRIIEEPDGMNYLVLLGEVWNVRRGYIFYRQNEIRQGQDDEVKSLADHSDKNFQAGIHLGNGFINTLFAMMPPSIFKVFSVIGYTGDGEAGINQLYACSDSNTIRAPIARIYLLVYYTIMCSSLSPNTDSLRCGTEERYNAVEALLKVAFERYPDSPIFLFFQGRARFLRHDVKGALESYELAEKNNNGGWPSFRLVIFWDLILGHMRMLQFEKCLEYAIPLARDSKWSIVFCMYLEIIFRSAVARLKADPSFLDPIEQMFTVMPSLEQRIAGRAFPMERFAITRGQMIVAGRCELKYPEYELMALWDSYSYMNTEILERAEKDVRSALKQGNMSKPSSTLLLISLAAIIRKQGNYTNNPEGSFQILSKILESPPKISCKCHTHILPLAHVDMAATLIGMEKLKEAKVHLNTASKWKVKHYLDRTIQVRCSKLAYAFRKHR